MPFVNPQEDISRFPILRAGDLVLADASEDMEDIGKAIEIIDVGSSKVIAGLHTITARPKQDKFSVGFLGHLFKSLYVRRQIQRESQGAKVLGLSPTRLSGISLPLPPTLPEQTHIAACLSSLDAVITAHTDKLAALRQHKRALMQQLFPQEGEKVPRLRFPEFEGSGEWEEKKLGEVCEMQAGKFIAASKIQDTYSEGLYPCYGGNGLRGYTNTKNLSGKYSLIGRQGALCGNVRLAQGDFYATEHALVVYPKKYFDTDYLYYYLELLNLNQYATGQAQPGLSVEVLKKIEIKTTLNIAEQQRIAACLSSLDDLIKAQSEKIDELKTFKRGLVQGLFPRGGEE